jgi:hypothetical protein
VPGDVLATPRLALAHQRGVGHDIARRHTGIMCPTATVTGKHPKRFEPVASWRSCQSSDAKQLCLIAISHGNSHGTIVGLEESAHD